LDCQYDGESSYSISSSALLWRTAHCSRSRTNNNTATALRRFRQPVNEGWPAYEAILRKNNIENTVIYPGVNHGFHNNTTPSTDAATVSWTRTIDFFKEQLNKK
jgi:dienelactone hydrolase